MTMPIPDGSVVITPAQMYAEIQETRKSVDRLVTTVDPALSDLRADVARGQMSIDTLFSARNNHGNRLTAIETKLNAAWAVITLLLVALGVVAAFLALGH